ncbi:MAG: hypothetical protein AAF750_06950 [Planctomycetota bacterium]
MSTRRHPKTHPRSTPASLLLSVCAMLLLTPNAAAEQPDADPEPDPHAITPHRTGTFTLTQRGVPVDLYLETRASYRRPDTAQLRTRYRREGINWITAEGRPAEWHVHVPDAYTPDTPHGILVYINSGNHGRIPREYTPLLTQFRLIAIGANHSGNKTSTVMRHSWAVQAARLISDHYNTHPNRVYVFGNSGGGRVTSQVMIMDCDEFNGAIPMIGTNAYLNVPVPDDPGKHWTGFWTDRPDRKRVAHARQNTRIAFLNGSNDFNQPQTKAICEAYRKDRFRHAVYLEQPGLGHRPASAEYFAKALTHLDRPVLEQANELHQQASRSDQRKRPGDALIAYRQAVAEGFAADWIDDATARLQELEARYTADLNAVESLIQPGAKRLEVNRELIRFFRAWGDAAKPDVDRLRPLIRDLD